MLSLSFITYCFIYQLACPPNADKNGIVNSEKSLSDLVVSEPLKQVSEAGLEGLDNGMGDIIRADRPKFPPVRFYHPMLLGRRVRYLRPRRAVKLDPELEKACCHLQPLLKNLNDVVKR